MSTPDTESDNAFREQLTGIAESLSSGPRRKTHGYWIPFAWATRAIVEKGYGVTEAVRAVLKRAGEDCTPKEIACVRVVYYKIRKQMWPEKLAHLKQGATGPTLEESPQKKSRLAGMEDFEA